MPNIPRQSKQLLHLVFGGELRSVSDDIEFKHPEKLDFVGIYPNYASAYAAWRAKAQGTVDNAEMRYFIVHLHYLIPQGCHQALLSMIDMRCNKIDGPMSALGQKQTSADSFDHPVGSGEHLGRQFKAECLRSLEVDH